MAATDASTGADLAGGGSADLAGAGGARCAARLRREWRKNPSMPLAFALVGACKVSGAICWVRALHNACDRPHSQSYCGQADTVAAKVDGEDQHHGEDQDQDHREEDGLEEEEAVVASIRVVTGFKNLPKFFDVGPLLQDPALLAWCTAAMAWSVHRMAPTHVAGVDARGFIFGPLVAMHLGLPFLMVRKRGKLPDEAAVSAAYAKEYAEADGLEQLAVQAGAVSMGDRVVVVDDVVATGSTLVAAENVLTQLGAAVVAHVCVVHMRGLGAAARVRAPIFAAVPRLE